MSSSSKSSSNWFGCSLGPRWLMWEKINYRITRRRAESGMAPKHYFHLYFPPSSIIAISWFSLLFFFPTSNSIHFHSNTIHYSIFLLFMLHLSYIYNILFFLLHKCISQTKEIQIHSTSSTSAIRPRKLFPFLSSLIFSLWFVSKIYFCLVIIKYNLLLRIRPDLKKEKLKHKTFVSSDREKIKT